MTCAEIVTFRTRDGVTEAEYLAAAQALDAWLKTCPGFITRKLSRSADGLWTDYLVWETEAHAKAAGEAFMSQPAAGGMMSLSIEESFAMRHEPILLAA